MILAAATDHVSQESHVDILLAAFALIRGAAGRISLVRSSASAYIRSAKRNIRNECAILIRRVKGTLREKLHSACVLARVTSLWNARASIDAHATRDYFAS